MSLSHKIIDIEYHTEWEIELKYKKLINSPDILK